MLHPCRHRPWPLATLDRGFHKVVGGKALGLFRPEELELLICGNPKLDFDALEEHSKYEDGYSRDDPVVKHFWEVRIELL